MKKIGKFLLTLAIVGCVSGSLLQVGSISKLKDDLVALGKQSIHYFVSLNQRIKELEDAQKDVPVMGEEATDTAMSDTSVTDTDTNQEIITQNPTMDTTKPQETTKPTMSTPPHTPETTPPELQTESVTKVDTEAEQDTETQTEPTTSDTTQQYRIGIYQGIIGVFDEEGHLIDTCNVSIMTLPQKDREMLEAGILVSTLEEVHALLENFV